MLNEEKISLMTKLAVYEGKKGKEDLKLSKFFKRDYVRLQLLKTMISVTVGVFLILILVLFYKFEFLIAEAVDLNYKLIGTSILGIYLVILILYVVAAIVSYSLKYNASRKTIGGYLKNLKMLRNFYKDEEKGLK